MKCSAIQLTPVWLAMVFGLWRDCAVADSASVRANEFRALDWPGMHNLYALGTNVYSGSTPTDDEGFAALATLGIKTIISVDGAMPDAGAARRHGMRYVHLPHGYEGINTNLQRQLAKAAGSLPGPVYVHCHHGKHRGPAAAAVICMANEGWTAEQATNWLIAAGTATNYAGLYRAIADFRALTPAEMARVPADFPEVVKPSGLVDAMVAIDDQWERLKAIRAAGYKAPVGSPDLEPANEALILFEQYREAKRLREAKRRGARFTSQIEAAEANAREAERLLNLFASGQRPEVLPGLDVIFKAMGENCSSCHAEHRD